MASRTISQLDITDTVLGTEYLLIDDTQRTTRTTVNTVVNALSTGIVQSIQTTSIPSWNSAYTTVQANSAFWSLSSNPNWDNVYTTVQPNSATWNNTYTIVRTSSATWSQGNSAVNTTVQSNSATWSQGNSAVDTVVRTSSAAWDSTYTVVKSNSGNWDNSTLLSRYGVQYNNIQIRGEVNSNTLRVYTALTVNNLPALQIGNIVADPNDKRGTIKFIDSINKILYIRDDNPATDFIIGSYSVSNQSSFVATHSNTFTTTLLPNHTIKIFNATDNTLSAVALPAGSVDVLPVTQSISPTTLYDYKIAQFKYSDGKFSIPSTSTASTSCYNIQPSLLNGNNFNRLLLKRSSNEYGIAIYRKTSNEEELGYRLLSILGARELGTVTASIPYLDRGGINSNIWAADIKSNVTGSYINNKVYYFPTNITDLSAEKYKTGFTTARVSAFTGKKQATVSKSLSGCNVPVDIFVDCSAMYNSTGELVGGFAKAIKDNAAGVISQIYIPDGTYFTSSMRLSSNIDIEGETKNSCCIKLLPWEFNERGFINASYVSNFNIRNITIDGNYANNAGRNNFENNFIINSRNSNKFVFENIDVVNSVGGGIYALRSEDFKIINSGIKNGSIELTADNRITGLFAQQASTFILNSNSFEGWLGPVDLSVTRIGSAANNVIKNCSTGIITYGATALQISPNLVLGQDNEMLPAVDLLDSKFDAINVELESGEEYISDIILYMRDGKSAWLSSLTNSNNPGTDVRLTTEIKTLVKTGNYCYTLPLSNFNYSTYSTNIPTISIISTEDNLKQGRVQFKLTAAAVNSLSSYGQLKQSYDALPNRPVGETLAGLVYKIKATEYLFTDPEEDDLIRISSYQFTDNGSVILNLFTKENISLFSINDIVYGVNLTNGLTIIDSMDLTVSNVVMERAGDNISTAYLICSGGYIINEPRNTPQDCINSNDDPSYIGIKNSFTISKGTINKI